MLTGGTEGAVCEARTTPMQLEAALKYRARGRANPSRIVPSGATPTWPAQWSHRTSPMVSTAWL